MCPFGGRCVLDCVDLFACFAKKSKPLLPVEEHTSSCAEDPENAPADDGSSQRVRLAKRQRTFYSLYMMRTHVRGARGSGAPSHLLC